MKISTHIDCIVVLDSFRMIDLLMYQEGMYQVRVQVYYLFAQECIKIPFIPKEILKINYEKNKPKKQQLHATGFRSSSIRGKFIQQIQQKLNMTTKENWLPAHILNEYNMFCSQAFLIRSWTEEEKLQIQNGCLFSIDIPQAHANQPVFLEVELLFNDMVASNKGQAQFKCISFAKYQIQDVQKGVFEYIPVIFSNEFFHLLNLTFFSSITSMKIEKLGYDQIKQSENEAHINQYAQQVFLTREQLEKQIQGLKEIEERFFQPLLIAQKSLNEFLTQVDSEIIYQERKSSTGGSGVKRRSLSSNHLITLQNEKQRWSNIKNQSQLSEISPLKYHLDSQNIVFHGRTMATKFQQAQTSVSQLWHKLHSKIRLQHHEFIICLKREQNMNQREIFQKFLIRETINIVDHTHTTVPNKEKFQQYAQECNDKRASFLIGQNIPRLGSSKVMDIKLLNELKDKFIIHERRYITTIPRKIISAQDKKFLVHLVVLVHGYQGHPFDMRMIEKYLALKFPQHMFLTSSQNQGQTEEFYRGYSQNGKTTCNRNKRVSNQLLSQRCFIENIVYRVQSRWFDCKSVSPIPRRLKRQALYIYLNQYTSFGISSQFPQTYQIWQKCLWILQTFKKSICLSQLCMKDQKKPEDSAMMTLSLMPGLQYFRHVILFGSNQDHYVTNESSLIFKIPNTDDIHNILAHNILRNLQQNEILRVTIDYSFEEGDMDTFLGRKAHIVILESHFLLQYLIYNLGDYLR